MSTETAKPQATREDVEKAFADSGHSLADLQRKQRAAVTTAAASEVRATPKVAPAPQIARCWDCKTLLPEGVETIFCDTCQAEKDKKKAVVEVEIAETIGWDKVGKDFPRRHRERLPLAFGPALDKARALFQHIKAGGMLLLHGDPGKGKTWIATYLEWMRLQQGGRPGKFMTAQELFSEIRHCWNTKTSERDYVRGLHNNPYLVIDELDERAASDWEDRTLFDLINGRYEDLRSLVLISNLKEEELINVYKRKFISRISEAGGLVECAWAINYRTQQPQK